MRSAKLLKYSSIFFAIFMASTAVAAKKKASAKSYSEPYGMAGCGLWTYVITDKEQGPQLGVWALRHFVFDSQTSAISSGTSNCVHARTEAKVQEQEIFIAVNLNDITKEAAQGGGEHIDALAEVFGCPTNEFARLSQDRYSSIFVGGKPTDVLQNYLREVNSDAILAGTCLRTS